MDVIVYEMQYGNTLPKDTSTITCIPMEEIFFKEYMPVYNACFSRRYALCKSFIHPENKPKSWC